MIVFPLKLINLIKKAMVVSYEKSSVEYELSKKIGIKIKTKTIQFMIKYYLNENSNKSIIIL